MAHQKSTIRARSPQGGKKKPRHRHSGKGRFSTAGGRAGSRGAGRPRSGTATRHTGREHGAETRERTTYQHRDRAERPSSGTRRDRADQSFSANQRRESARTDRSFRSDKRREPSSRPASTAKREQTAVVATDTRPTPAVSGPTGSFENFSLPTALLRGLRAQGIQAPFPIQAATLPDAIDGRDVLGRAQTGSGKTLAFGLAMLTRLYGGKAHPKRPRAIALVPTRELAMQVADALTPLAKEARLWVRTVVGGMSFDRQAQALHRGVDLLIATPGRLSDHVRQGTADLSGVEIVTLDEADRMADMGFLPQVREILDLTPATGQRLLFSATLDNAVGTLVREYMDDPVQHSVAPTTASVDTMDHHVFQVAHADKPAVAAEIGARTGRTILFVRTKHHADRVAKQMRKVGVPAAALHGGKTQGQRNRVLEEFKDGRCSALVATDVAARGIHVDDVSLVVHIDPPNDAKDYLHRAGRTARAGATGTVVTLLTPDQKRSMRRIIQQAGVQPSTIQVRPGDAELARITGAQQPSGEPLRDPVERRGGGKRSPQRRR